MTGNAQPNNAPWDVPESDDEHLADFKRRESLVQRINRERVLAMAHNVRHLGRRSLSHLRSRLQSGMRRDTRKAKELGHEPQ